MSLSPTLPDHSFCYYLHSEGRFFALPLVSAAAETTVKTTSSRTILKQTFVNVDHDAIQECSYQFPLYDGATIVSFRCLVGDKEIVGVVKERDEARADFDAAVARGQTAGLLEQSQAASDVFRTSIGNVPTDSTVVVEITYVSELKHDAESDGIRFEMPTKVAPRYGGDQADARAAFHGLWYNCSTDRMPIESGFRWTAKIQLSEPISNVQSPSHPVSINLGRLELDESGEEPSLNHCRVEMSTPQSTGLSSELVLIIKAKGTKQPLALLETHSAIDEQRALMVTLVPNFTLKPIRPEIVFVCDRSGSMSASYGSDGTTPIKLAADALKILLHSLPPGVKFNICSFGSSHKFLFPKSESLSKQSLQQAMLLVNAFRADFGGTQTYEAVKATIDNRYGDIPLDIILLTDGDIWRQEELFHYVTQQVSQTEGQIRIFPLGIGSGVSSALIEGVGRAGNGFAQMVMEGERMENRCVRMLKAAMSPHINDYRLEIKYEEQPDDDSDFELVEKPEGALNLPIRTASESSELPQKRKIVSLFDPSIDADNLQESEIDLPKVTVPKVLQAPFNLPALYAFSRTTAYLMLSPDAAQRKPKAVILRGTAGDTDLRLEIPVQDIGTGTTIHQLAARKATQDLEEGRSWLHETKGEESLQTKHPSSFDDLVKAEAIRLGTTYQVMNRWCSFVAIDTKSRQRLNSLDEGANEDVSFQSPHEQLLEFAPVGRGGLRSGGRGGGMAGLRHRMMVSGGRKKRKSGQASSEPAYRPPIILSGGLSNTRMDTSSPFSAAAASAPTPPALMALSIPLGATLQTGAVEHGGSGPVYGKMAALHHAADARYTVSKRASSGFASLATDKETEEHAEADEDISKLAPMARLHRIIDLQDFEGFWSIGDILQLQKLIGMSDLENESNKTDVRITTLVINHLETQMADQQDVWELVVEKARNWLENQASHVS